MVFNGSGIGDLRMTVAISSGHGLHVPGARGLIDEVTEARRVTDRVSAILRDTGVRVNAFHENTARNQRDNVNAIVRHHNNLQRDIDVSVHFNSVAGGTRDAGIGTEVMYRTGNATTRPVASRVARAIAGASGLILRRGDGTFPSTAIGFLNNTNISCAILIEVCFVNSHTDVRLYQAHFEAICYAIASAIIGRAISPPAVAPITPDLPPMNDTAAYEEDDMTQAKFNIMFDIAMNAYLAGVATRNQAPNDFNNAVNRGLISDVRQDEPVNRHALGAFGNRLVEAVLRETNAK